MKESQKDVPERQLRFVQLGCILFLLACLFALYLGFLGKHEFKGSMSFLQFLVIVAALWSAVSGFTVQRRIAASRPGARSKSTPFSQWRAGHLWRLGSATAVALYGLVLHELDGPVSVVYALFALGLVLLALWKPEKRPQLGAQNNV